MKFNKWKFIKERMYEIFLSLDLKGFTFGLSIADVDFEIHLLNCRERLECEGKN